MHYFFLLINFLFYTIYLVPTSFSMYRLVSFIESSLEICITHEKQTFEQMQFVSLI